MDTQQPPVLLFDGVCNVCNALVQFVIRHDRRANIRFTSLQSTTAETLLQKIGFSQNLDTVVLITGNQVFIKSSAALQLLKYLDGWWHWGSILLVVPVWVRDPFYDWFARNRYRFFGKKDACMLPTPDIARRFLV